MKRIFLSTGLVIFLMVSIARNAECTLLSWYLSGKINVEAPYGPPEFADFPFIKDHDGTRFYGTLDFEYDPFNLFDPNYPDFYLMQVNFRINFSDFFISSYQDYPFVFSLTASENHDCFSLSIDHAPLTPPLLWGHTDSLGLAFYDRSGKGFSDILSPIGLPLSLDPSKFNKGEIFVALYPFADLPAEIFLTGSFHAHPAPEPGTLLLLGTGLVGLVALGTKKIKKQL